MKLNRDYILRLERGWKAYGDYPHVALVVTLNRDDYGQNHPKYSHYFTNESGNGLFVLNGDGGLHQIAGTMQFDNHCGVTSLRNRLIKALGLEAG